MIENFTAAGPAQTQHSASEREHKSDKSIEILAAGFSFNAALSALEGRAAQSLETFGAVPVNASPTKPQTQQYTSQQAHTDAAPDQTASERPVKQTATPARPETSNITPALQSNAQAQPVPAHSVQAVAAPAGIAAQTGASAAQPATATRGEAASIRTAEGEKAALLKTARATTAPKPTVQPTQDFARLLARRLDAGATSFELRLDPPSLGRVEAQLNIADNGEKVLALKFEHQSTLDLFSKDETALRTALDFSDFEADHHRLTFSLAERENDVVATTPSTDLTSFYDEPLFNAPFSRGVIDVRI